jgi:hypothetical protein
MKRALVGLMVAAVAAMGAMGGMAANPQNVKLQFFTSHPNAGVATATAGWVTGGTDFDNDGAFVKITTGASGTGSFAGFIPHGTALETGTVTVSGMTNLAFAMDSNFVGLGAPRYSIELSDGNVIFASASHCGATADPTPFSAYQTVTFLSGGTSSCTFFWSGGPISGGNWDTVKATFPTQTVKKVVMVQDEGAAEVHLDKIVVQNCTYTTNTGATCS